MNTATKQRLAEAVDRLAAKGISAKTLRLSLDTAREAGILGTHLDLRCWPDAAQIAAELIHPDYDRNPARDDQARPKSADQAAALASGSCQKHLRRDCVLAVVLDPALESGKIVVDGTSTITHIEEA